jgi:hypothetical protein
MLGPVGHIASLLAYAATGVALVDATAGTVHEVRFDLGLSPGSS